MKRFFYFFAAILGLLIGISTGNAQTVFDGVRENIRTGMEKAKGGVSAEEKMPFGSVRLASCRTGIKDLKALITGVEVSLDKDWVLKDVRIFPVKNKKYKATVLPVFNTKKTISEDWETDYINNPVFPIWLEPKAKGKINLGVIVDFKACHAISGVCDYFSGILELKLAGDEAYATNACGALNHSLKTAAVDIDKTTVKVNHQLLKNGDLKIRFIFPKDVSALEIQKTNQNQFKEVFSKIDGNVFTTILHRDTPVKVGNKINFNIRSSNGCYIVKMKVKNKDDLPQLPQELSWWNIFWTGLIFFILSPVWCFWLSPQKMGKTEKELKKKIRLLQLAIAMGLIISLVLWILNIPVTGLWNYPIMIWLLLLLAIYLLIKPIQPIWFVGILILILPKPFWDTVAFVPDKTKIGITIWWFVCLYIPLNIWLLSPKAVLKFFNQIQKENIEAYPHVVRLPYWILLAEMILIIGGQIYYRADNISKPETVAKPAIIRVTTPTCLSCLKERAFIFSSLNKQTLPIYRIDAKNEWAKQKKKDYQIRKSSFNLLLTEDGREIVLPEKLSRYQLKSTLERVSRP